MKMLVLQVCNWDNKVKRSPFLRLYCKPTSKVDTYVGQLVNMQRGILMVDKDVNKYLKIITF